MTTRPRPRRRELTLDEYERGIAAGDRTILARAITLVESARPDHERLRDNAGMSFELESG